MLDFFAKPKCGMEPLRPNSIVRFGTNEVSLQSSEVRKIGFENQRAAAANETAGDIAGAPGESGHSGGIAQPGLIRRRLRDFDQA